MARSSLSLVVLALAAAIPVGHWMARPATAAPRGTVVDVALADPRFSTLVAAVKAAGLVETLSGPGPFTVLAPTDEAFRALPAGTVETLLKPENVSQLAAIISYHVLPGRVTAADLARGTPMKTVLGPTVTARFDGGRLLLGSAPVLATDVDASNGVVHVIGAVLLPPAAPAAAPTGRLARAVGVVERALDVGVPLYNGGNHAACAAAYELAALSVATLADDVVPADVRDALLAAVASRAAPMDRAWTLRAALDRVLALATPRTGAAAPPPAPARATASAAVPASSIVLDRAGFATSFERAAAALDARDRAGALALVDDAVRRLGSDSRAGARLATASAAAASGEVTGVTALRRLLLELRDDFRFEPMREAETPAGWPTPTTVGEVELKRYPAYRMARADGAGNSGFFTLFNHIKRNDIAMTAPVQMDYERTDGSSSGAMGFLYGSTAVGRTGREGAVEVMDVPASQVASIGVRGPLGSRALDDARAALEAWLARHPEWTAAGPVRSMGWNSPFVERERQFFEVQLPLTASRP